MSFCKVVESFGYNEHNGRLDSSLGFPVLTNLYKPNEKITLNPFYSAAILQSSFFSFFRIHRLVERRCGQVVESFGYNEHNGRLEETRKSCQRRPTKYTYAPNSHRVSEYVLYMIIILYSAPFSPLAFHSGLLVCI